MTKVVKHITLDIEQLKNPAHTQSGFCPVSPIKSYRQPIGY